MALWLNPTTVSQRRWLVGRDKEGQTSHWLLRLRDGIPELALPGVSGPGIYSADTALIANTWQHVAFTFANGTVIAYINGVETRRYSGIGGQFNANASASKTVGRSVDGPDISHITSNPVLFVPFINPSREISIKRFLI
ncbi:MAG TPA: hypothetical protein DCR93_08425 [Cytophagales bacterium]|nr:hypothetical protein [Cytophagales bacterium]